MLKTNSKKAITNIRNYIVDWFSEEEDFTGGIDPKNFNQVAQVIYNDFISCCWCANQQRYYNYNMQQAFIDYCRGLPSAINTLYYYNRCAVKDLGDILEETDEERNKYTEQQAEEMLTKLIYREIKKVVEVEL